MCGMVKVSQSVISLCLQFQLITLTKTLVIVLKKKRKTHHVEEVNQSAMFLLHCAYDATPPVNLTLLLDIVHCTGNLQTIALFPIVNCRLLANVKTDVDYHV